MLDLSSMTQFNPSQPRRGPNILVVAEDLGFERNNDLLSTIEIEVSRQFRLVYTRAAHLPSTSEEAPKDETILIASSRRPLVTAQELAPTLGGVEFLLVHLKCMNMGFEAVKMLFQLGLQFKIGMLDINDKDEATVMWFPSRLIQK